MRLTVLFLFCSSCFAQFFPFPGPGNPASGGGGGGSVTTVGSPQKLTPTGGSVSTVTTLTQAVSATAGNTLTGGFGFCTDGACAAQHGGSGTILSATCARGSDVCTVLTGPGTTGEFLYTFSVKNATGGSVNLVLTVTFSTGNFGAVFPTLLLFESAGASLTSPVDTAVTASASGTSTAPAVTSAGNVTNANEMVYCFVEAFGNVTGFSGAFTVASGASSTAASASSSHPTAGSGLTCTGAMGSSLAWSAAMVAVSW